MLSRLLVLASAAVVAAFGALHLWFTFVRPALRPRDPELEDRLKTALPVITKRTTMWKAWIGFNASHSFGALLFGAVYGYLAVVQPAVLFQSWFLMLAGGSFLGGYIILGKLYWYSTPYRGILLASACYAAGVITART